MRTLELPANRQQVIGALKAIITDVQDRCGKPLLVITDGLDKAPPGRARLLFAESRLLTEPACSLIYAAPIELYHRLSAGHARDRRPVPTADGCGPDSNLRRPPS